MKRCLFFTMLFVFAVVVVSCKKKITRDDDASTVTDIDGNEYQTVKIGEQLWMAENLKVIHYRNGDAIPNVSDNAGWDNLTTGAQCAYDNAPANVAVYGRLYNWYAVEDSRGLAPEGWHVPTDADWKQLEMFLGMSEAEANAEGWRGTDEGGKLKETGTAHWTDPNTGATDESGFTALPSGYRHADGVYKEIGSSAGFWTSTAYDANNGWYRFLRASLKELFRYYIYKENGFSVRCIRN